MKKQINVPSIIFSRFNEDSSWKLKKFKELLDPTEGIRRGPFGSALKKELFVQNSEYVVYEQQNAIYDHFNTRYRISEEKYHELKKFMLLPGDFIMSGAGTIGKISLVPEGIEKGVFNQALIRLRVNKNTDKAFFLQWMRSPEMQNKLTKANPASAMVNLVPMSEVKEWDVIVPSFHEQSAIGYLFRTLDDLLASYKDNLTNYQFLKATMLSKMFPKVGQRVPEIRLDGFEGEWEVQTLKELARFSKGNGYIKNDLVNSGKEIILYGQLYTNYQTVISKVNTFVTTVKANAVISKGGEVIVPASGESAEDISRASVVEKSGIILGGDLNIIYPDKKKVDSIFLALTISNGSQQKELIKRAQGKSVVHLRNKDLEKVILHYPSIAEQQAIGAYFSNLDNLINSHQEKITQLEALKKKLLQDMFI